MQSSSVLVSLQPVKPETTQIYLRTRTQFNCTS